MPSRKCPQTRRTNQGSRTCKPNSVHGIAPAGRPFLWAAHHCSALATYPKVRRTGPARVRGRSRVLPSYLVLLRVGFALPAPLLSRRCALTAPFHPYPGVAAVAVYFLWHFPSSDPSYSSLGPSRTLSGTLPCGVRTFLSSPPKVREAAVRSGCLPIHYIESLTRSPVPRTALLLTFLARTPVYRPDAAMCVRLYTY